MKNEHDVIRYFLSSSQQAEGEGRTAEQLKQFVDWMPGGFFIYYAGGNEEIIYANEAVLRMFGCETIEEFRALTGNSFRGIVHPEDLDMVEESIQHQISDSQFDLDYVEYRIIRKDGEVRWVDDYGHFIRSSIGDVFCVFIGDATEKKLAHLQREISLQSRVEAYHRELEGISEEYLRRLEVIEGLSADYESIFYIDLDADTIQTYQLSDRLFGQFEQEGRTRPFSDFCREYVDTWVCPEDREAVSAFLAPDGLREKLSDRKMYDVNYRVIKGEKTEYLQFHVVNNGGEGRVNQVVLGARNVDEAVRSDMM